MEGVLSKGVLSEGVLSEGVLSGGGFVLPSSRIGGVDCVKEKHKYRINNRSITTQITPYSVLNVHVDIYVYSKLTYIPGGIGLPQLHKKLLEHYCQ